MAKKTIEKFYSDISGDEIEDNVKSLNFAFDGTSYEIDLTAKERDEFASALKPYIDVARKSGRSTSKTSAGAKRDLAPIREWAAKNNIEVSARGRIAQSVIDQYDAAH